MKKTALIFLALISNTALAGSMGPICKADDITAPCVDKGWDFGIQALYLRPSFSSAMAWVGVDSTAPFLTYTYRVENGPQWAWGFKLEGAYRFDTGNDLNLNWYHLSDPSTTTYSREAPFSYAEVGANATSVSPGWDAVNLELGQRLDFGDIKNIRVYGGLQVVNIKTDMRTSGAASDGENPAVTSYFAEQNSKYTGIGPRVGIDMAYGVSPSFNLYGQGAVAALVGRSKFNQNYANNAGVLGSFTIAQTTTNATVVSPELEARLGFNYTYPIIRGTMTLDAGYLWANYFNALFAGRLSASRAVDVNFSVNGPYLGLKWIGAAV